MDSGVPQTSKRDGLRAGGGGVGKSGDGKGAAAKSNGNGSARPGPVDPRTEDPSAPVGTPRSGKTLWRRPGALIPRTAKHRETGDINAPIDFSVELPLSLAVSDPLIPAPVDTVDSAATVDTVDEVAVESLPAADPTFDLWTSTEDLDALLATELVATDLAETELAPTELVPTELAPPYEPLPAELRTLPMPVLLPAPSPPILYDEAASIDDVTMIGPVLETRPLRRPVHFRRAPRPRVRRVTRIVRHVDTWSVFKVALVFSVFFYAVALIAGVLLWQVAYATGTIDNVEKFFEGFGWETFKFNGGQIFHNAWIAGLFIAVGLTGLAVLLATLFNLITDLVGGVRFSVLEEEVRTRAERGTAHVHEPAAVSVDPPLEPPVVDDVPEFDESLASPPDEAIVG